MKITLPSFVKKAIGIVEKAGHEAYAVGGAVRDALLGRPTHDYDLTTSALPEETAEIFSGHKVFKTGLKHGTVTVIVEKEPLEITTFRVDGEYKDSRHPDQVRFTRSLEEDLARRDFTVNAMAYSDSAGVIDIFGGKADLEKRLIRAVGVAEKRFEEDALRILRAFRFVSKLGFEIEEKTLLAAKEKSSLLRNISQERKSAELEGILLGAYAKKALLLMSENGVLKEVAPPINIEEKRLDKLCELPSDFAVRMAFCLVGSEEADSFVSTLKLSNAISSEIKKLAKAAAEELPSSFDREVREFLARLGDSADALLKIKRALGEEVEETARKAQEIKRRGDCLYIKDLAVDGADLQSIGIKGREIGSTLASLLSAVLDDPSANSKDKLLSLAGKLAKKEG